MGKQLCNLNPTQEKQPVLLSQGQSWEWTLHMSDAQPLSFSALWHHGRLFMGAIGAFSVYLWGEACKHHAVQDTVQSMPQQTNLYPVIFPFKPGPDICSVKIWPNFSPAEIQFLPRVHCGINQCYFGPLLPAGRGRRRLQGTDRLEREVKYDIMRGRPETIFTPLISLDLSILPP